MPECPRVPTTQPTSVFSWRLSLQLVWTRQSVAPTTLAVNWAIQASLWLQLLECRLSVSRPSEFLRQRQQEGLPLAELGSADAYAQTVADLILVVEQVDDVETQLRALAEPDRYFLHERGVDDGVVG